MRLPFPPLSQGDIFGVVFAIIVLVVVVFASLTYPDLFWQRASRANFGPDWDCQYMPKGEPVCIKRTPRNAPD